MLGLGLSGSMRKHRNSSANNSNLPTANLPRLSGPRPGLSGGADHWRRMRVLQRHPDKNAIIGELTGVYSFAEVYAEAQLKKDPYVSPHGTFRGLAMGNRWHAIRFLEEFGPLTANPREMGKGKIIRVELTDFWEQQRRFSLVAKLYQNRDDPKALRTAIDEYLDFFPTVAWTDNQYRELVQGFLAAKERLRTELAGLDARARSLDLEDLEESIRVSAADAASFGLAPKTMRNLRRIAVARDLAEALHQPEKSLVTETTKMAFTLDPEHVRHRLAEGDDTRSIALWFVQKEIQYGTRGIRFSWSHADGDDRFYPSIHFDSLLSAIWDQFARDTNQRLQPRICPNDGNLFYPRRRDQFYCTSQEQTQASKQRYELQGRMLRAKKKKRRR